jgi:O-succinylbenzoic acid--CoA ligase
MAELVAIDLEGGPDFVGELERIWSDGDAAFPIDRRLPAAMQAAQMAAFGVGAVATADGRRRLGDGRPVEPGDALVIATSGSTGAPKGVVLTHAAVAASATASSDRLAVTAGDHWLACLPLAHIAGLSVVTRALHTGTALTVLPGFDAGVVAASDATLVSLVATALARTDVSRFRRVLVGGSRPPAERPPNCLATYGMTETGSGIAYDGVPLDGVEVRIVDGEVQLRGAMLLRAYRDGTDPFLPGGWFPTGDDGRWLDDGRLHVDGRRGEVIVTGGEKVWPEPVEAVLATHPDVVDVAVSGTADPEWGAVVTAHVVTGRDDLSLDELREHAKAVLPAYAAPRRLVRVAAVPRTALGKVRRRALDES